MPLSTAISDFLKTCSDNDNKMVRGRINDVVIGISYLRNKILDKTVAASLGDKALAKAEIQYILTEPVYEEFTSSPENSDIKAFFDRVSALQGQKVNNNYLAEFEKVINFFTGESFLKRFKHLVLREQEMRIQYNVISALSTASKASELDKRVNLAINKTNFPTIATRQGMFNDIYGVMAAQEIAKLMAPLIDLKVKLSSDDAKVKLPSDDADINLNALKDSGDAIHKTTKEPSEEDAGKYPWSAIQARLAKGESVTAEECIALLDKTSPWSIQEFTDRVNATKHLEEEQLPKKEVMVDTHYTRGSNDILKIREVFHEKFNKKSIGSDFYRYDDIINDASRVYSGNPKNFNQLTKLPRHLKNMGAIIKKLKEIKPRSRSFPSIFSHTCKRSSEAKTYLVEALSEARTSLKNYFLDDIKTAINNIPKQDGEAQRWLDTASDTLSDIGELLLLGSEESITSANDFVNILNAQYVASRKTISPEQRDMLFNILEKFQDIQSGLMEPEHHLDVKRPISPRRT